MANIDTALIESVIGLRPFVPAKDFELSKRFYRDIGFTIVSDSGGVAEMSLGKFVFLLQNHYDKTWAEYTALHLYVKDLQAWWKHISSLDLANKYGVQPPVAPAMQNWNMEVSYFHDPSNVIWHVALADAVCLNRMAMAPEFASKPI